MGSVVVEVGSGLAVGVVKAWLVVVVVCVDGRLGLGAVEVEVDGLVWMVEEALGVEGSSSSSESSSQAISSSSLVVVVAPMERNG